VDQVRTGMAAQAAARIQERESKFWATLDSLAPDWRAINTRQDWLSYLDLKVPGSGLPRQAFVDDAVRALDAPRLAEIIQEFKAAMGWTQGNGTGQGNAQPQGQFTPAASAQAAPRAQRAAGTDPGKDPSKRVYTLAEMEQFRSDVARGKIRPEDAAAISREHIAAVREGRVA
jgi:hypothetical protein